MQRYFKERPDCYGRMIAAYAIGYAITTDDLAANPHMKFAKGESDTGVVISWNTEGKKSVKVAFSEAYEDAGCNRGPARKSSS